MNRGLAPRVGLAFFLLGLWWWRPIWERFLGAVLLLVGGWLAANCRREAQRIYDQSGASVFDAEGPGRAWVGLLAIGICLVAMGLLWLVV